MLIINVITMSSYQALVSFTGTVSEMREFLDDLVQSARPDPTKPTEIKAQSSPSDGSESSSGEDNMPF